MSPLRALEKAGRPETKESWYDRVHYYSALQLAENLKEKANPMPIGWPWDDKKMRELGVKRIEGTLEVNEAGRIVNLRLKKTSEFKKENMRAIGGLLYGIPSVPASGGERQICGRRIRARVWSCGLKGRCGRAGGGSESQRSQRVARSAQSDQGLLGGIAGFASKAPTRGRERWAR